VFLYDANGVNLNSKYPNFNFNELYDVFNTKNQIFQKYTNPEIVLEIGNIFINTQLQDENVQQIHVIVKYFVDTLSNNIKVDDLIYNVLKLLYGSIKNKVVYIALPYMYHPIVPCLCASERLNVSTMEIINKVIENAEKDSYKITLI
jgi:hypothetical protein